MKKVSRYFTNKTKTPRQKRGLESKRSKKAGKCFALFILIRHSAGVMQLRQVDTKGNGLPENNEKPSRQVFLAG